jgi:hypothetical protein
MEEASTLSDEINSPINRPNVDVDKGRERLCTGNEGNRLDPMFMGGTVAGLGGSSTIEGVAAGGGVQVEGRTSDTIIFEAQLDRQEDESPESVPRLPRATQEPTIVTRTLSNCLRRYTCTQSCVICDFSSLFITRPLAVEFEPL